MLINLHRKKNMLYCKHFKQLIESTMSQLWTCSFVTKVQLASVVWKTARWSSKYRKYKRTPSAILMPFSCLQRMLLLFPSFHFQSPDGLQKPLPPQLTYYGKKYLIHPSYKAQSTSTALVSRKSVLLSHSLCITKKNTDFC